MSCFTNTYYAVRQNLQVMVLLYTSLTLATRLPGFINCNVAEHCKGVSQPQSCLCFEPAPRGASCPCLGVSPGPRGGSCHPVGHSTLHSTQAMGRQGTNVCCPVGSSSGLCKGSSFGGCGCLSQGCNSLISGDVVTNPFIKEMRVCNF